MSVPRDGFKPRNSGNGIGTRIARHKVVISLCLAFVLLMPLVSVPYSHGLVRSLIGAMQVGKNKASAYSLFPPALENGLNDTFANLVLTQNPPVANARFGFMVTAGDYNHDGYSDLAVGNPYGFANGAEPGTVWIYYGGPNGLKSTPDLTLLSGNSSDQAQFGRRVASGDLNGDGYDDLAVSSPWATSGGQANQGLVDIFYGGPRGLSPVANLTFTKGPALAGNFFGRELEVADVNGDGKADVIVGNPFYDSNRIMNNGEVDIYFGSNTGIKSTPSETIRNSYLPQKGTQFGYTVRAGDINGDGVKDLVVGAWGANITQAGKSYNRTGDVQIFYSVKGLGPHQTPDVVLTRSPLISDAKFGRWVGVGDLNGDGKADVLVGAPFATSTNDGEGDNIKLTNDSSQFQNGEAWVYYGGPIFNTTANAILKKVPPEENSVFGRRLIACDANSDGYSDAIISAYQATNNSTRNGEVAVFLGGPNKNFDNHADILLSRKISNTHDSSANFGETLACGDFNGDHKTDLAIGAFTASTNASSSGEVHIFYGGKGPFQPDPDGDAIPSSIDNCPNTYNPDQKDTDGDGIGDACDPAPNDPRPDSDYDHVVDALDNCPAVYNPSQQDTDHDGIGDACDLSPTDPNNDFDHDGVKDQVDNCPKTYNPSQTDTDGDGFGDVCDNDIDNDGIANANDNCIYVFNPDQKDTDKDGYGDVCDTYPTDPSRH